MSEKEYKLLPVYYELLRTANEASEDVDRYDLHSEDESSVAAFRELQCDCFSAQADLLWFINENNEELAAELDAASKDN